MMLTGYIVGFNNTNPFSFKADWQKGMLVWMKKQSAKRIILLISCALLVILIAFRSIFSDKKDDGEKKNKEISEKETILNEEAYRLFDFLAVIQREDNGTEMTCGEFRDALLAICDLLSISYSELITNLPERLYEVTEDDVLLYLEEFLYVYEYIIFLAKEAGIDIKINEKSAYVLGYTEMPEKSGTKATIVTGEGERLKLFNAPDYSDVLAYLLHKDTLEENKEMSNNNLTVPGDISVLKSRKDRLMTAEYCIDKSFRILCAGNEIIYFIEETQEECVLHNAYVINGKDKEISIFAEGIERTISSKKLSEEITGSVADITILSGQVIGITLKQGSINGKVLMVDEECIEIEGYGKLLIDPYMRIYKIYNELEMERTNVVLVGYSNTDFIVIDGKICAALITQKITADNIRVLIKSDGFASNYHTSVVFTSERSFTVRQGEEVKKYQADEQVTVTKEDMEKGRITVIPETENSKIKLLSVKRSTGNPSYRGIIEIAEMEDGLIIINDLSLEEYLYAVVPSEMPVSYGLEALKVQAVCARSYAYNQLMANQYRSYGAHVDDSVNYQVYNNIPEEENSTLAVKETYGMVMEYEGNVITAYYFSTSSGHTASVEDVWENGSETAYLKGNLQIDKKPYIDLTDESIFRDFIFEKPEKLTTYDSGYSYYRWNVTITAEELTKRINDILYSRYQANKSSVMTMVIEKEAANLSENQNSNTQKIINNKIFISKPVKSIGTVKNISVISRGTGGIIKELMIEGDKDTILVSYQTNVRMLLAPVNNELLRSDGTTVNGMTLLPSAYCAIDKVTENGKTSFLITGGGYGHGVGMSQNGTRTMVLKGNTYSEVLKHYYPGVDLTIIYK